MGVNFIVGLGLGAWTRMGGIFLDFLFTFVSLFGNFLSCLFFVSTLVSVTVS